MGTAMRQGTAQQRLGTAMKASQAVGYPGNKPKPAPGTGPAQALEETKKTSEDDNFKEMEEEVHRLLESSAELKVKGQQTEALAKAKEAASKEKKIRQIRESTGSLD